MDMTLQALASYFDHTQLRAYAARADFEKLCQEGINYGFAMLAINPAPVRLCKELLGNAQIHVGAAVGFPLGQNTIAVKTAEALDAINNGADEIDYVINIGQLKDKQYGYIAEEMQQIVSLCREHQVISKVIFENCYLTQAEKEEMCRIAMDVRPDYIKTSTGFGVGGATLEDVELMLRLTRGEVKVKAAGGIRTLDMALQLIDMGVSRIGSTASVAIVEELRSRS